MEKIAKLVYVSLGTRVVVHKDADDRQIWQRAKLQLMEDLQNGGMDYIESIEDDIQVPFGEAPGDELYFEIED